MFAIPLSVSCAVTERAILNIVAGQNSIDKSITVFAQKT